MRSLFFMFILSVASATTVKASDSTTTVAPTVTKWSDVSLWQIVKIKADQKAPILWVNHEHVKFFLEARLNFDWQNTVGFLMGKTFSKKPTFWITPKAGILCGATKDAYNGISLEANLGGAKKKFGYFVMGQTACSFQKKNPVFLYGFANLQYNVNEYFALSSAQQIYWEVTSDQPAIDIGPQVTISVKGFYFKTWYTGNPISYLQKVTFGLGCKF